MADYPPPYHTFPVPDPEDRGAPSEKVGVIGYGNQGRAQALNLRDSGLEVSVGLRESSPHRKVASADGLRVESIARVAESSTAVFILIPDEFIGKGAEIVQKHARAGSILILAHGASVHFGHWKPRRDLDCGLIAPHGPGIEMRRLYEEGSGLPAILAEIQNSTGGCRKRIEYFASVLGCSRPGAGVRWSTLKEEVETDLFVEQAFLVGGVMELLRAVVATMIRAGYDPAVCRMSTVFELQQIAWLYDRLGPVEAFKAISQTAQFGAATRGPRLVDQHTRRVLEDVLEEIRNGTFAKELMSPEAPLIVQKYLSELQGSNLAGADELFHVGPRDPE